MSAEMPTFEELYLLGKAEIQARNPLLVDFIEGSGLDAFVGAAAALADEINRVTAQQFANTFYTTAEGDALDTLALDHIGLTRKPAVGATGLVTWTRGASIIAYTIPQGAIFRATVNGVSTDVLVTQATTIAVGVASVPVPCQVILAAGATEGRQTNLAANTVTTVVSAPGVPGGEPASITNPLPFAGGADEETDEDFRARIRLFFGTLAHGTVDALEFGALLVPGVDIVVVDESTIEDDHTVRVYVGDIDARSNTDMTTAVATELENWRCAGIQLLVVGSTRQEVALTIEVEVEQGSNLNALAVAIQNTVSAYGDTLGAGESAKVSRIEKAVHDASDLVLACDLTSPVETGEIEPSVVGNAIRFPTSSITLQFTVV